MKNTTRKAFTIVELVIVIAIIAVLAAVLVPTFVSIVHMAKVSNDTQLIRNLNTILQVDRASGNDHPTMQSALDAAQKAGYDIGKINKNAAAENEILWDSQNDMFCYLTESGIDYIPESNMTDDKRPTNTVAYWRITDDATLANGGAYSVYLNGAAPADGKVTTTVGFDAGTTTGITSVTYIGGTDAKDVVIRTNSYGTDLTIKAYVASDGTGDKIEHYGTCGTLTTETLATQSYHEYGSVAVANVQSGRIVAESKGSLIGNIALAYVTNGAAIAQENGGTITAAYASSAEVKTQSESLGSLGLQYDESGAPEMIEQLKYIALESAKTSEVLDRDDEYVARIGMNGYKTLSECNKAAAELADPITIIVMKDIELNEAVTIDNKVTKIEGIKDATATENTDKYYTITINGSGKFEWNRSSNESLDSSTAIDIIAVNINNQTSSYANLKIIGKGNNTATQYTYVLGDIQTPRVYRYKSSNKTYKNIDHLHFYGTVTVDSVKTASTYVRYYGPVIVTGEKIEDGGFYNTVSRPNGEKFTSVSGYFYMPLDIEKFYSILPNTATITEYSATLSTPARYKVTNTTTTSNMVAQIGTDKYASLSVAIANAASGDTITLLKNASIDYVHVRYNINGLTLDLGGYTLTCTNTDKAGIYVEGVADSTVTIKNGILKAEKLTRESGTAAVMLVYSNRNVVLDHVTITTTADYGIATNGNNSNNNITVQNGSKISGAQWGIYAPASGIVTIADSEVSGTVTGIEIRRGSLSVTGTSIVSGGNGTYSVVENNNGTTTSNAAIAITPYDSDSITVTIEAAVTLNGTKDISKQDKDGVTYSQVKVIDQRTSEDESAS